MQVPEGNLITRDDTILGVCQGLAEDLGFNPLFLRIGFAVLLYLNPVGAIAGYFGLGIVVLISRLIAPNPRRAAAPASPAALQEAAPAPANVNPEELAVAA